MESFSILPDVFTWSITGLVCTVLVGVGFAVMSMAPPAFVMAKWSFTLAALFFFAKLGFWLASSRGAALERVALTVVLFALGSVCWVELLHWVDSREPSPEFGDSSVLTHARRDRITRVYRAFCGYLRDVGFDIPAPIAPLQVSHTRGTIGQVGNPYSPHGDTIFIAADIVDDAHAIRRAYAGYIFHRLLEVSRYEISDHANRWEAANVLADYFTDSYSGDLLPRSNWRSALWNMRSLLGKRLMDRALMEAVALFDQPGGDEKGDFDVFFRTRLKNGLLPLIQGSSNGLKVNEILAAHHLLGN